MPIDFTYRRNAVGKLSTENGVYVLCDLDGVPIYVGRSTDGIKKRVQRHLTSARSDIIANRQVDVWEIAFVWEYPVSDKKEIGILEGAIFHKFNPKSQLMNGTIPPAPPVDFKVPTAPKIVQVMSDAEIKEKKDLELRLSRQASHYAQIVGHFLTVKNSKDIARAMDAHFQRLSKYHALMLGLGSEGDSE